MAVHLVSLYFVFGAYKEFKAIERESGRQSGSLIPQVNTLLPQVRPNQ